MKITIDPEENYKQTIPLVGQYLYSSCAGDDYGKIIKVGKDSNGVDCIDIELKNPDDILSFENVSEGGGFGNHALTTLEVPENIKLILRDVQYKKLNYDWCFAIECNTPGDGCHRCTKAFVVRNISAEESLNVL